MIVNALLMFWSERNDLLEYQIAANFVGGKFSIRQKFSYILGIVYILDKNSMLSGIAQGPVKSIHFCYCFPKRT